MVSSPYTEQGELEAGISTVELPRIDWLEEAEIPASEASQSGAGPDGRDDLFSHSRQRISRHGRILVSRRAWAFRGLTVLGILAFMIFNVRVALSVGDPLIVYSTVMPFHALAVLIIGWVFFKNRATGATPDQLVSVIIPVFNQEQMIEKVIDAIFRSSYPNLEVVAVNDGSKDNTAAVLDALTIKNPALKVLHQPNGGKRTAVATGFYAASGDVVVLIDSDSIVDKYAIEEFMKVFAANPRVGGVVGNGKVLNAGKNLLTRCQDVWYDYSFNIRKTTESFFGTVLCLSGCLAAYRRETISRFVSFWAKDKAQYGDDRNLTSYAIATPWAKGQLAPLERRLLKAMSSYDDAEDRGLTSQAIIEWETVYVPMAIVYTEVPEKWRQYLRQQIRWRKGFLRSTFFISAFFWRKNPLMAALFYIEFMSTFIAPAITFSIFVYGPLVLDSYLYPLLYVGGQLLIGLAAGLDYRFRDPTARYWKYKPVMNMISAFVLPWVLFPAVWGLKKNTWLTR
ncbi:MAG: glycosyltransferase family 2 protein [Chloroflexi bacterium]|nr:glycosyltransferase family 2 protein [Chloroflexota bacterium]